MKYALNNINKENEYLFKTRKMIPITCDGRKGLPDKGQFDVIHVGGAVERIPPEFEE